MKSSVKRARLWGNIHFLPFFCRAPLFAPCALLFFPLYHPRSHHPSLLSLRSSIYRFPLLLAQHFFFLSLDLRLGARTQTWHTREQSIPLLNYTSFISSGLFSLARFKQRRGDGILKSCQGLSLHSALMSLRCCESKHTHTHTHTLTRHLYISRQHENPSLVYTHLNIHTVQMRLWLQQSFWPMTTQLPSSVLIRKACYLI